MIKSKYMARGGVATTLIFLVSLFISCNQSGLGKNRIKSSNANVKSITINSQSFDLEKEETELQEFYVDEDMEETELLSQVVVLFEDANAKKEVVGENENAFEKKPHEEKVYTINTIAEDGTQGKSYKVKLIRFIMDKTVEVKAPSSSFKSGLEFNFKPDYMALGNGRTIDFDTYKIAKYEVTRKLWREVYEAGKANGYKFNWEPPTQEEKKEDLLKPIVNISWADALVWCNAYSDYKKSKGLDFTPLYVKEGTEEAIRDASLYGEITKAEVLLNKQGVRLPTEVEWEVAARGGDVTKPEWKYDFSGTHDETKLGEYAWFGSNSNGKFHRVGEKKPNSIGLYDMAGNAGEFCFDFIDMDKPFKQTGSVINPVGFKTGAVPSRVEKGGNVHKEGKHLKLANRSAIILIPSIEDDGFRFVEAKNTRAFTYEEEPVECEVEEIKVGEKVFTKDKLATLNGASVSVSSTPTTIIVKYSGASAKALLKINSDKVVASFENGVATASVETKQKTNSIELEVSDIGKKNVSWSFKIENSNGEGGVLPPPPPPPPPGPNPPPPPPLPGT